MNNDVEKKNGWRVKAYFSGNGPSSQFDLRLYNKPGEDYSLGELVAGVKERHQGLVVVGPVESTGEKGKKT